MPTPTDNNNRLSTLLILGMVLLATLLRVYQLNSGLWYDEIITLLDSVRLPLWEIVTTYPGNNDHLLYSVLANLSINLFGEEPWSLRLPAVIFGVASIPMLYVLGNSVTNRFETLLATSIMVVSYHHIWFSQNARGYTILLFLVLLASYLIIRWWVHGKKFHYVAYAVIAAAGAYTHLTMVVVVITHAVICSAAMYAAYRASGAMRDWKAPVMGFLGGGILTLLLYSPLFLDMTQFFTETAEAQPVVTPLWAILAAISGLELAFGAIWIVAVGAIFFSAGILSYFRQSPVIVSLFLLPAPVTLMLGVAMGRPIFPRFIFFVFGFGLLIAVRGAVAIGEWAANRVAAGPPGTKPAGVQRAGMIMAAVLTVAAIAQSLRSLPYGYENPKQDYATAVAFASEKQAMGDTVAVIGKPTAVPIQRYVGKSWARIDDVGQYDVARPTAANLWLIFTFPAYIETSQPELWRVIQRDCKLDRAFDGTVENGAILVYRCPAANNAPRS